MKFEKLMETKLNNKILRLVILTKNVNIFVLTRAKFPCAQFELPLIVICKGVIMK